MNIYLAGAIRDGNAEDIHWRERFITAIDAEFGRRGLVKPAFLNPLGNKWFDPETRYWFVGPRVATGRHIVKQDLWCVERADLVIANLLALGEGYPNIGTLMELGAAAAKTTRTLIYLIVPDHFTGHSNNAMFARHPFLEQVAAEIFTTTDECQEFCISHLPMMTGNIPSFGGIGPRGGHDGSTREG